MTDATAPPAPAGSSWKFPRSFWTANGAELFERAAYYGLFIVQTVYFTSVLRYGDIKAGVISGIFASAMYFLPTLSGLLADHIGFRRALMLAFGCLTVGYALIGFASVGLPPLLLDIVVISGLAIQTFGGSIVKPVISGTVAKTSSSENRARAFSIFYAMVNIGAFSGKSLAYPIRTQLGVENVAYYSAAMSFIALVLVALFYRSVDREASNRTVRDVLQQLLRVLANVRFLTLIVITAGFWTIQHQLYASMPKYILRTVGPGASPEWLANINPFVVVVFVVPITHLVRHWKPISSIAVSLFMIPFSALLMALGPLVAGAGGHDVTIAGFPINAIVLMAILGIALQGLAECFLSPKYLEFASKQAPENEVGLYMGYTHLNSFFSLLFGFVLSGLLLDAYCPDPEKLRQTDPAAFAQWEAAIAGDGAMPAAFAHAHYIWYVFAGIGFAAFVALMIFKTITDAIDRRNAATI